MSRREDFFNFLQSNLVGINVFADYVPAGADTPALSVVTIIGESNDNRVLNGDSTGKRSVYRLSLTGNTEVELEQVENAVQLLDNTSNDIYTRVFLDEIVPIPRDTDSVIFVSQVDITIYMR